MEPHVFLCDCKKAEHLFIFRIDADSEFPWLSLEVHLNTWKGFWKRLWAGLKYAFGHRSKYGVFDEVIITKADAERIRELMQRYIEGGKK